MGTFKAEVQYRDWEGTAAADDSDQIRIQRYLEDRGLMTDNDYLLSVSLWSGENSHGKVESVFAHAYILEGINSHDAVKRAIADRSKPIKVRGENFELSLEKFVGMFKRFSVSLTADGLELEGREFWESNR